MPENSLTTQQNDQITHIGLLVVHGVGEQCQFEHLQEVAKKLAVGLESNPFNKGLEVYVHINKLGSGPLGAREQTWDATKSAPIILKVKDSMRGKTTWFHLREVWWADIDPPSSIGKTLGFWFWGLSLWGTRGFIKGPILNNYANSLILAEPVPPQVFKKSLFQFRLPWLSKSQPTSGQRKIPLYARIEYFGVAVLFFLLQPILSFLNLILQAFGTSLKIDVLSQYMSKLRLYQRKGEKGKGPLPDLNNPPRFTVRRRMITALVQMATSGYERWYILSHSLGAIVAFNGLSEPEQSLANYLDEPTWILACQKGLHRPDNEQRNEPITFINLRNMKPSRPPWLERGARIYRHQLFKDLRGLMTYGAPLRHFVDLWPMIMLCNQDRSAFSTSFKWFNIYDPSDPVATEAEHIFPNHYTGIRPKDIAYKAQGFHLLSHICYLERDKQPDNALVNRLLDWMMEDIPGRVEETSEFSGRWLQRKQINRHRLFRYIFWWLLGYIGAWILSAIGATFNYFRSYLLNPEPIPKLLFPWSNNHLYTSSKVFLNISLWALFWVVLAVIIAVLMGAGRMLMVRERAEQRIMEFFEDQANSPFTLPEIVDRFDYREAQVRNTLENLAQRKEIRKTDESPPRYFLPRYQPVFIGEAKSTVEQLQSRERLKLRRLVSKELSFEPDVSLDNDDNRDWFPDLGHWLIVLDKWYISYKLLPGNQAVDPTVAIIKIQ